MTRLTLAGACYALGDRTAQIIARILAQADRIEAVETGRIEVWWDRRGVHQLWLWERDRGS